MPKLIDNLPEKLKQEACRQLFEAGYNAVNIRTIAKNCDVGIGTVYNYFPSKDSLLAAILVDDWMLSLERIRVIADEKKLEMTLSAVYQELHEFYEKYTELFHSAAESIPAPPRQYHKILRNQIAQVLDPMCVSPFAAEFAAEALLVWTIEGKSFEQINGILQKAL